MVFYKFWIADGICEKHKIVVQAGVVYGCINAIKHCAPFRFSEESVIAIEVCHGYFERDSCAVNLTWTI